VALRREKPRGEFSGETNRFGQGRQRELGLGAWAAVAALLLSHSGGTGSLRLHGGGMTVPG